MSDEKNSVLLGMLGVQTDQRNDSGRWRPTVSIFQQSARRFSRFELIVQPEFLSLAEEVREDIRALSPETEVNFHEVDFAGDPWNFESVFAALFDLVRGYPWDPDEEDYFVHISTGTHTCQICFFLLTEARHMPGRLLQSHPETKPDARGRALPFTIIDLELKRYSALAERLRHQQLEAGDFLKDGIATRNAWFNGLIEELEHVALNSSAPILLTGPTGAGKSRLARRLYDLRRRRGLVKGDFVEVNCGTIRGDGAMSTLFGHLKGSFTGALKDRPGLLKAAHGGVLFLDEIGELGNDEQVMLLRALEEKRFLPLGADSEVGSEFQLICGTNRDLAAEVASGGFRADLFSRINLWSFALPPLRERLEDFEPNLNFELEKSRETTGMNVYFTQGARKAFLEFAQEPESLWTGNFRDLNAAVTRMATLAQNGVITLEIVKREQERLRTQWQPEGAGPEDASPGADVLEMLMDPEALEELDPFDRVQLAHVITVCRRSRNLSAAGRELFRVSLGRRKTSNDADRLRKYLGRFGLSWAEICEA